MHKQLKINRKLARDSAEREADRGAVWQREKEASESRGSAYEPVCCGSEGMEERPLVCMHCDSPSPARGFGLDLSGF